MEDYIVSGGYPLCGRLSVYGAKNAVLPVLAGSILGSDAVFLKNCPRLSDVSYTLEILRRLGCRVAAEGGEVMINPASASSWRLDAGPAGEMRSSVNFLGALVGRYGRAELPMPGGCRLGSRPIDLHVRAFREMGVNVEVSGGVIRAEGRPRGTDVRLDFPSVGATENVILAAVMSKGITTLSNAAREPEIADLCGFLTAMGAKIRGAGTGTIRVEGVPSLGGCEYEIMPDRIVAGTYMCAAAAAGGEIEIENVIRPHVEAVADVLVRCGADIAFADDRALVRVRHPLRSAGVVRTEVYPGFPTDCQSQLMAVMACGREKGVIVENIFENRFRIVPELRRMGAEIRVNGPKAEVRGGALRGAELFAGDLRGGAALVIAALGARGESRIHGVDYIARGYQDLAGELSSVGARISVGK